MLRKATLMATLLVLALTLLMVVGCGDDDGEDRSGLLALDGEETVLALDEKTARALGKDGIDLDAVDPSSVGFAGIEFPIVGGEIDAQASAGTIDHAGGIRFSSGGKRLKLTDFVVDIEAGTLTATTSAGPDLSTLNLDLSGVERTEKDGEIVLGGISATLSRAAATALNDAFSTSIFSRGLSMGEMTVTATVA